MVGENRLTPIPFMHEPVLGIPSGLPGSQLTEERYRKHAGLV